MSVPHRVRRALPVLAGAAMLLLLLDHVGWAAVQHVISATGPWCLAIVAIDVVGLACDAGAIASFARTRAEVSYRRAFVAQASGYAINQLTPGASVGELVKIAMVGAEAPRDVAISAVVLYNLATVVVGAAAVVLGAPFALLVLHAPPLAMGIGIGAVLLAVGSLALVLRRGLCATAIGLARRCRVVGADQATRWCARTTAIDAHLRELGGPASHRGLAFACASRAAGWLGTLVLLPALGVPLSAPFVIAVLSLGVLVSWISDAMPLGIGLADGGQFALYGALGAAPAAGLAFAMSARARTCLAGLVALALAALITRGAVRFPHGALGNELASAR